MYYLKKDIMPVLYWEGLLKYVLYLNLATLLMMNIPVRGLWGGPGTLRKAVGGGN